MEEQHSRLYSMPEDQTKKDCTFICSFISGEFISFYVYKPFLILIRIRLYIWLITVWFFFIFLFHFIKVYITDRFMNKNWEEIKSTDW
jgi:hypothetical protein